MSDIKRLYEHKLFEEALCIKPPLFITGVEFDSKRKQLDIFINFKRGSSVSYKNKEYKAYDKKHKVWRHLNFFDNKCYIHYSAPRIKTAGNGVKLISPPWAGLNYGFTLLFEALIIKFCSNMPVISFSRMINENDDKIWRLLDKYIQNARKYSDFSKVTAIGMDETSRAKGHDYITLFVDLEQRRTIFVTDGKDNTTVKRFVTDFKEHRGDPEAIKDVSCDMSPAYIKGIKENFPKAQITFDKFHIIKLINEAVDQVRKEESARQPLLKNTKYIFLKNTQNLTEKERKKLEKLKLSSLNIKTLKALQIRENFQAIYEAPTEEAFVFLLKKWFFWATHSRLTPIIKAANTIKNHWNGVVAWKRSQINNGILEGLNSVIQANKSKARGFSSFHNYKIIVYLTTGNLDFKKINPYF